MLLRVDAGETITMRERRDVVILADREELTITWSRYASGERGPDLHVHREHTDAFYVLAGELTFEVGPGAERIRAPAGTFVAVPPNVVHSFANEGSAESRWLNMHAPDNGFAAYLRAARDGLDATWDSFDPPADGGLPATGVIVTGPGEGERHESGHRAALLKGVLPELAVAEWVLDRPGLSRDEDPLVWCYALDGRMLSVHAPDGGFAASLRR
jgi:quercetin dioxygenase-like cupin family protein